MRTAKTQLTKLRQESNTLLLAYLFLCVMYLHKKHKRCGKRPAAMNFRVKNATFIAYRIHELATERY